MTDAQENPWLTIPAADYEGHMGPGGVGQLAVLADLLGATCRELRPERVLVLGCATGNGFDRVDPAVTRRLTGVDLNPEYLQIARDRHGGVWDDRLELLCARLETLNLPAGSQDLVFAGLVFEYLSPEFLLDRLAVWLAPGGTCETVLQLPSATSAQIAPSRFQSLGRLAEVMRLVPPGEFEAAAGRVGLTVNPAREIPLPHGKRFHVVRLRSPVGQPIVRSARQGIDYRAARGLFEDYARGLGVDLCFQGFSAELESLTTVYGPPSGCLLLLELAGEILGCIGVRRLESAVGELKRMYLRPAVRGRGFGRRLVGEALLAARGLGCRTIRLDTLARMAPAVGLYRSLGFSEIPPYRDNPLPDALFLERGVSDPE